MSSEQQQQQKRALVISGSRGLGHALVHELGSRSHQVYTTVRSSSPPTGQDALPSTTRIIANVDLARQGASCDVLEKAIEPGTKFDLVIFSAGVFMKDDLHTLDWQNSIDMYTTCALAPLFVAALLVKLKAFNDGAQFLLVTTEGGSIALRTKEEGGGMYGHHVSKAAANMSAKMLSLDLADEGVTVVAIHPGFMRTTMTASIGFDKYYDEGGAVTPQEAATSLVDFSENDVGGGGGGGSSSSRSEMNGSFWAPRGPRDIGQAENVMGKNLPTPLQLPW